MPRPFKHHLSGFSLVELLVVMGIIGFLVSALMPAIENTREKAQTTQCASNLHQLGMAVLRVMSGRRMG